MIAGFGTGEAGFDAGLELLVGHGGSPQKDQNLRARNALKAA
jgi:hypothetical protein